MSSEDVGAVAMRNMVADNNEDEEEEGNGAALYVCMAISLLILAVTFPLTIFFCFKIVNQYERAVVLRMGRLSGGVRQPGLMFVLPCMDDVKVVDIRSFVCQIKHQNILTKDSASVRVNAVVQARIMPKAQTIMCIENAPVLVQLKAASTLRNVLAHHTLTDIIGDTQKISAQIMSELYRRAGGLKLERVEIKDICLPHDMQRAMAAEAESSRAARAKVIFADAEKTASNFLKEASQSMGHSKIALNLRYLQTLRGMAAEKDTTILFPIPMNFQPGKRKQQ